MLRNFLSLVGFLLIVSFVHADTQEYEIKIINHRFVPDIIYANSGSLIKLKIINTDTTIEEFESFDLKREKIVPSNGGKITIRVGPLKPGSYHFFGEFHQETAQGKIIIK